MFEIRRWDRERTSRRRLLQIGSLGALGLSLPHVLAGESKKAPKACILIFLFGGPSQLETFDLKPRAPVDFRGEFRPIPTNVPGIEISEHLPRLALSAHRYTLIRSMHHEHPRHGWGLYHMFTGRKHSRPDLDAPPTPDDHPGLGAMVTYSNHVSLSRRGTAETAPRGLPPAITLPRWNKFNDLPDEYAGEKAGFIGKEFDPWLVAGDLGTGDFQTPGIDLPSDVSISRFETRIGLRQQLDRELADWGERANSAKVDNLYTQAASLISSSQARRAFHLEEESPSTRLRYGHHPLGKGLLLARRLVEAGTTLVTVNWHNDQSDVKSPFWDTHRDNFATLRDRLIPPTDQAVSSLLEDLDQRGILDSTLVLMMGEFGRTPRIGRVVMNAATDASGRDHWPHAYSVLIAGGGIRGGRVWGSTDDRAAYVASDPVSPPDLVATVLYSLGIDQSLSIYDRFQRPWALSDGIPVRELFKS